LVFCDWKKQVPDRAPMEFEVRIERNQGCEEQVKIKMYHQQKIQI
jgi:hypothetical protein